MSQQAKGDDQDDPDQWSGGARERDRHSRLSFRLHCSTSDLCGLICNLLDVAAKFLVFTLKQFRESGSKIRSMTPISHVIFPRLPKPPALFAHVFLVYEHVCPLKQRN
jgi:hypothetical protein